jgi:hypothetical protein
MEHTIDKLSKSFLEELKSASPSIEDNCDITSTLVDTKKKTVSFTFSYDDTEECGVPTIFHCY